MMNGFVYCHIWIKEHLDSKCIEDFKLLDNDPRAKKSALYSNLFDQFSKLNIKTFYACKGRNIDVFIKKLTIFKIIKLVKNGMNDKKREILEIIRYEKTARKSY